MIVICHFGRICHKTDMISDGFVHSDKELEVGKCEI